MADSKIEKLKLAYHFLDQCTGSEWHPDEYQKWKRFGEALETDVGFIPVFALAAARCAIYDRINELTAAKCGESEGKQEGGQQSCGKNA